MEEKKSVWKETLQYGIILGLVSIVFSVLTYMLDVTGKPWVIVPSLIISIVVLYLLLRSYRDTYNHGFISYGKAVGAGVVMNIYAALLTAIYIYILFGFIDPGLVDKQMLEAEEKLIAKGIPEGSIDTALQMQAKFMKPWFMALSSVFSAAFFGLILSLIVSLFIKNEGNPLLDDEGKE
ncbi:MAG TPA: DUF4199 domain-containing protein [Bacteroidales bacterium]|nr:DUF4199 domain-containing protein [Bacteroidales bacterium]